MKVHIKPEDRQNVVETAKVIAEILESRGVSLGQVEQHLVLPWRQAGYLDLVTETEVEHYERRTYAGDELGAVHRHKGSGFQWHAWVPGQRLVQVKSLSEGKALVDAAIEGGDHGPLVYLKLAP